MKNIRLVFCTFPDAAVARQIGTVLVEKQLAACVNLIPGVESIYRWLETVESSSEVLAIFKTNADTLSEFQRELGRLHPYDVAEIVAVQPTDVAENYASWLHGSLKFGTPTTPA